MNKHYAKIANHPVAVAVAPLRASAIQNATKHAKAMVAKAEQMLKDAGWDLDVVAPAGKSWGKDADSQYVYREKQAKHMFFVSLTERAPPANGQWHVTGEKDIRVMSPERVAKYIETCKEEAAASYEGYVYKLVGKLGEGVKAAALRGDALWARSTLTVTREDGSTEAWLTQQIWNVSVLGKVFPQWPTRQTEGAKRAVAAKQVIVHLDRNYNGRDNRGGKMCVAGYSQTRYNGVYTKDTTKVTCTRCKQYIH